MSRVSIRVSSTMIAVARLHAVFSYSTSLTARRSGWLVSIKSCYVSQFA